MLQKPAVIEPSHYTPSELALIVKAQFGALTEVIDKVNACTAKLKQVAGQFDEIDMGHVGKEITDFVLTIDKTA